MGEGALRPHQQAPRSAQRVRHRRLGRADERLRLLRAHPARGQLDRHRGRRRGRDAQPRMRWRRTSRTGRWPTRRPRSRSLDAPSCPARTASGSARGGRGCGRSSCARSSRLAEAHRLAGDPSAAVRAADELVTLDPFRERGYRLLMQAQSDAGNDAEALRVYERCRELLAEELGRIRRLRRRPCISTFSGARPGPRDAENQPTIDGLPTAAAPAAASRSRRSKRWPAALLGAVAARRGRRCSRRRHGA